jgi:hypothetical protein
MNPVVQPEAEGAEEPSAAEDEAPAEPAAAVDAEESAEEPVEAAGVQDERGPLRPSPSWV